MKAIKYCGRKYQTTHYNKIKRNDTINDRRNFFQGLLKVHRVKNLEILLTKILRVVYILRVKKIIFKYLIEYKSAV